jgi:hypothetical protein
MEHKYAAFQSWMNRLNNLPLSDDEKKQYSKKNGYNIDQI